MPEGAEWVYQLKLDGYRAIAYKSGSKVFLRSRNDNDFTVRYPQIAKALAKLPNETVIDGEIVALDESGKPSFNALQNYRAGTPLVYFVFDVMILSGRDVRGEAMDRRRALLETKILTKLHEPIRYPQDLHASLPELMQSVRTTGLEGLAAKRRASMYEAGQRSGAWRKMRMNHGQEFVIGGYTVAGSTFDAVIFGYYEGDHLLYVARTRNGFTPQLRQQLAKRFEQLVTSECSFANLPEPRGGRWGAGLTAAKMKDCVWLRPMLVAQFEYLEWTPENHLRHSKFLALREDKMAMDVVRE